MPEPGPVKLVIAVDLVIQGQCERFMAMLATNAEATLRDEAGCLRFDVCVDPTDASRLFLYEIYEDKAAFLVHLASPHYLEFDRQTSGLIAHKAVRRYKLKAG